MSSGAGRQIRENGESKVAMTRVKRHKEVIIGKEERWWEERNLSTVMEGRKHE